MKSEERVVNNTDERFASALDMADEFIDSLGIDAKDALHMRLLVEETLGMVKAMTRDFKAVFWIECEENEYRIKLSAKTSMEMEKKDQLLSVSKSGKNAAARGFMGKISDIIENSMLSLNEVNSLNEQYGVGVVNYGSMGAGMVAGTPVIAGDSFQWTLDNYRSALDEAEDGDPARAAYDELEKSIVAKLAKDVIVGVKKDKVDMEIIGELKYTTA